MKTDIILAPDPKYEALCILERISASKEDDSYMWVDMQVTCEHYKTKLHLSDEEFAKYLLPIQRVYDHVKNCLEPVSDDTKRLFKQIENTDVSVARLIFACEREILKNNVSADDEKNYVIMQTILTHLSNDTSDEETDCSDLMHFVNELDKYDISDENKYTMIKMLSDYSSFSKKVNVILTLAASYYNEKAELLDPLLYDWKSGHTDTTKDNLKNYLNTLGIRFDNDDFVIQPVFMRFAGISAYCISMTVNKKKSPEIMTFEVGVLFDIMSDMADARGNCTTDLVNDLKAISDTNRMDILISLKSGKKYARELMDLTGLTSATVSHHMGELIARQLVTVEKSGVRLYYTLKKEKINEIADGLHNIFI